MFSFSKISIKLKGKKGVSPIIATVLLIAFAVALGAVVMNWGKGFVEDTAKDTQTKANLELSCSQQLTLDIKSIGQRPIVCYNKSSPQYVEVMLENKGTVDISGMQIMLFDSTDASKNINNDTLTIPAGTVTNKFKINHSLTGDIVQVEFIPKITPKGAVNSQLCSKNSLVVTDLTTC